MLNLYREHTQSCTQERRPRLHTRKAQESPRYGWKKCDCPIYASGKLKDGFRRKRTDYTIWEKAEEQATTWERAGVWDAVPASSPLAASGNESVTSVMPLKDAFEAFERKCEKRGIADSTLRKYKTFTKQFGEYCNRKGYVHTRQLKVADGELFYQTWKDNARAAGRKLERFRKLVKYWKKQGWIEHDLGLFDIDTPIGANETADRFPYSDDELERFYAACDAVGEVTWTNHTGTHSWHGQDVKDFIVLSIYTGLRISDVALFDVAERMNGNDIFIRAKKNGRRLYTWVPDWVRDMLHDRQHKYGNKVFQVGRSERLDTVTDLWRRKLARIFEEAQKNGKQLEHKAVPHRLRHTFIRILLENGVPVPDVAELAGDTEDVINKYYSKWVPERQERLRNILKDAFKEKTKLVVMPRKRA